ncbi:MAG: GNAT family N-acetyltransferase [Planctomycetaceae bacterium]|nr:GNAT family N-acetyltransferase [Planctomycetaceae bacterium]
MARLLSSSPGDAERERAVDLIAAAESGRHDLRGLWVAASLAGLADVVWWLPQPDDVALVWLAANMSSLEGRTELLAQVCEDMDARGVPLSQVLIERRDDPTVGPLEATGYVHGATLAFWGRAVEPEEFEGAEALAGIGFKPGQNEDLFAETLGQTYIDSLDIPDFTPHRTPEQALACHRAADGARPELWNVYRSGAETVGILLLADHPDHDAIELQYFGIVPQYRGQGWGRRLLSAALKTAADLGRSSVFLAADITNHFAIDGYTRMGFSELSRRDVYWRRGDVVKRQH